jgi:mono/diheme cytochrome c family protein
VDMTTAPDGTVYITDMYHGIIQEATWSGRGTYLRARIEQYDLDKVIHKGRIWRLVYDGVKVDRSDVLARDTTMPRMNDETPAQLVAHLGHPNGWWRDTAQQLLVLKQDKSVVPALRQRLTTSTNLLEKFHVLWTLEGLDALDAATVRREMQDANPRMRIQAIRASETLYKGGDRTFGADYKRMATDQDVDVVIQAMLTMDRWKAPDAAATIRATAQANRARGVQYFSNALLNPAAGGGRAGGGPGGRGGGPTFTTEQQAAIERGGQIYTELCFSCHGSDGYGAPRPGDSSGATMAPRLAGSPRMSGHRDYVVKAVLHGVTGPVDGETYTETMIPMNAQSDAWVSAIASYVRTSFGNSGGFVSVADVMRVRSATAARRTMWTVPELEASLPRALINDGSWKLSASHNAAAVNNALSMTSWSSAASQVPGMWFQVELGQPVMVTELSFDSTGGGRGGGGGARGAAPAAAPGAPAAAAAGAGRGVVAAGPAAPAAAPAGGGAPNLGYPRGYKVETSLNGTAWTVAAEGTGQGATTVVTFRPVRAKFVKITQTATADNAPPWSVQQLRIFEIPVAPTPAR